MGRKTNNKRLNSKRRRNVHARVYMLSGWQCEMPTCYAPEPPGRAINRELLGTEDPWAPTIDHITPLAYGGVAGPKNMRAAHKFCNNYAGREAAYTIGDRYPELEFLVKLIVRE